MSSKIFFRMSYTECMWKSLPNKYGTCLIVDMDLIEKFNRKIIDCLDKMLYNIRKDSIIYRYNRRKELIEIRSLLSKTGSGCFLLFLYQEV